MPKTRSLTVYLLKKGFDHSNTLIEDHDLELIETRQISQMEAFFACWISKPIPLGGRASLEFQSH